MPAVLRQTTHLPSVTKYLKLRKLFQEAFRAQTRQRDETDPGSLQADEIQGRQSDVAPVAVTADVPTDSLAAAETGGEAVTVDFRESCPVFAPLLFGPRLSCSAEMD